MPDRIVLETGRLRLRRFTPADAPLLVELDSDPAVMRFISKGVPTPPDVIREKVLPRWIAWYESIAPFGYWALEERDGGAFAGWHHLRPDRISPGEQELGYRLLRRYWGRGYAAEAGRALIHKAFTEWDVEKISARTLVANKASQRVMEKCGLVFEETFRYSRRLLPGWTDDERLAVKYGLDRTAYVGRQPE